VFAWVKNGEEEMGKVRIPHLDLEEIRVGGSKNGRNK